MQQDSHRTKSQQKQMHYQKKVNGGMAAITMVTHTHNRTCDKRTEYANRHRYDSPNESDVLCMDSTHAVEGQAKHMHSPANFARHQL